MKADLILKNARIRDVASFDILVGESFSLVLDSDVSLRWFSDNDNVLSIASSGGSAQIKASEVGPCEIQLQADNAIVKQFFINVISEPAASLNITFGNPQPK
jgi:hypothetical protein